jgi:hypothetical protein
MPRHLVFAEDTERPLVLQLGTSRDPLDLTGRTPRILLRDLETNTRIDTDHTDVQDPPSAGRVQRDFQDGELVVGRRYAIECIVDYPDGQTYPDATQHPLEIEVVRRRTSPVP